MKSEETQETCRRCGKPSPADQGDHLILTEDLVTSPAWGGIQAWQEITEDDLAYICQPCVVALEGSDEWLIYARHCCGCNEPFPILADFTRCDCGEATCEWCLEKLDGKCADCGAAISS